MSHTKSAIPARILAAAEGLFAEFGYQGCSLLKIAKASGTSESGVLRFFSTKEDVFLAVIESALDILHHRLDRDLRALPEALANDPVEQLLSVLKSVLELYHETPDKIALIFSEGGLSIRMLRGSQGRTLMTLPGMLKLVDRITALFSKGRQQGTFRGVDPVAAREIYFGLIEGVILGWLLSSDSAAPYRSAAPKKVLVAARMMLGGLAAGSRKVRPVNRRQPTGGDTGKYP